MLDTNLIRTVHNLSSNSSAQSHLVPDGGYSHASLHSTLLDAAITAVPTWDDAVAPVIRGPQYAGLHVNAVSLVEMATLQQSESILNLGCGT